MNPMLMETADLAFVMSIPDHVAGVKPGRLKNLLARLRKETESALERMPAVLSWDRALMQRSIEAFDAKMGWSGNGGHHISKAVSFALERLDGKRPEITKILCDLFDYFERADDIPAMTEAEAAQSAAIWKESFEKQFAEKESGNE